MIDAKLNARLSSAVSLVRQDAVFADIGTDHAYLPIFLLKVGRISRAYATDINSGPLASARANVEAAALSEKVSFMLTDGAAALSGEGVTDYAICGMGGELIADIIERAPHLRCGEVRLILQPMSRQEHLRRYLCSHSFAIRSESYSYDGGKYYTCIMAEYVGECRELTELEALAGVTGCQFLNTGARIGYLEAKLSSLERARAGRLSSGAEDRTDIIISALRELISDVKYSKSNNGEEPI